MSADTKKRLSLYGLGLFVLAALLYAGFFYRADPDYDTLVGNAEALAKWGMPDDAIAVAEQAHARRPDDRYPHIILAHCYTRKEDFDRAVASYHRALELTPAGDKTRDPLVLYLAEALARAGRVPEAKREIRGVLERSPELVNAYVLLGSICLTEGDSGEAMATVRAGMAKLPQNHQLPALLAEIEFEAGKTEDAKRHLERALELAGDRSRDLASDLEGLGASPEAGLLREEAARLTRRRAGITLGLARIFASEGNREEAERRILAAAALDRRLTARTVRADEALKAFGDDPDVIAELEDTTAGAGEKN